MKSFVCSAMAFAWFSAALCSSTRSDADDTRPIRVHLQWANQTADPTCLDQPRLAQAVELRLQRKAFVPASPDVLLQGVLVQDQSRRIARMTLKRPGGEVVGLRELESPDPTCSTLNEAIPLSVALMIDYQQRVLRLHVPRIEPPPSSEPPPPEKPAPLLEERKHPETWRLGPRIGVSADLGVLPSMSWSPRIGIDASYAWTSLRVEGAWLVPRTASFTECDVTLTGWTVGMAGCASFLRTPRWGASTCVGAEAGRLLSSGAGFEQNRDGASTLGNAWIGLESLTRFTRDWGVGLGLHGGVPIVPQRFEYTNDLGETPTLFESAPIFGRLFLSLVYSHPTDQKPGP
jgi:hypothetical protein